MREATDICDSPSFHYTQSFLYTKQTNLYIHDSLPTCTPISCRLRHSTMPYSLYVVGKVIIHHDNYVFIRNPVLVQDLVGMAHICLGVESSVCEEYTLSQL